MEYMENDVSKTNIKEVLKKICLIIFLILAVVAFIIYKLNVKTQVTYTVVNGYIENIVDAKSILLKKENKIDFDKNNSFIPVIEEGKRVAKDGIVAIYKNSQYDEYLKKINELDSSIELLIKDLPATYSVDVSKINAEIEELSEKALTVNSYVKMQEYKTKLDEYSYKKVSILSNLSPVGSKIRELTNEREKLESEYKNSENNIKSTVSGIVSYKIDNLENAIDFDKILKYSTKEYDEIIEKYNSNNSNEFGIKIINNYEAYIVAKIPRIENDDNFIKEDQKYNLKISNTENMEISAKLVRRLKNEENNYLIFEINSYIEEFSNTRELGIEIVWEKTEGMAVLKNAILRNEEKQYDYVILVNGGQFLETPIKIIRSSDSICIVENLSNEEKEMLGAPTSTILELYDILVVQEE